MLCVCLKAVSGYLQICREKREKICIWPKLNLHASRILNKNQPLRVQSSKSWCTRGRFHLFSPAGDQKKGNARGPAAYLYKHHGIYWKHSICGVCARADINNATAAGGTRALLPLASAHPRHLVAAVCEKG